MSRYINKLRGVVDVIGEDLRARKSKIELSTRTKLVTYCQINPSLSNHPIYSLTELVAEDNMHTVFTRFRLSSHRLKIETDRWCGIAPDLRLCQCAQSVD